MTVKLIPWLPRGFEALAFYPHIYVIRPLSSGLWYHELVHFNEQKEVGRWTWWWKYLTNRKFRVAAEVRAYRAQIAAGGISLSLAAMWLQKYDSSLSHTQALELLS